MSGEVWDGRRAVLVDTSAWMLARRVPQARELLLAAIERGDVAWCWPVRYDFERLGTLLGVGTPWIAEPSA